MTSRFSWPNCQSLSCFILYSKAKLACYSTYCLTSNFCIPVPYDEKDIFFLVLVLEGLQVFLERFNFRFFGISGWGIDMDYCDIEWFALETKIILSLLRLHPSTVFQTLLLAMMATPFFLRDSVHGILQTRILEWVGIPFLRGSSQPRDQTQVSRIAGRFFTS